MSKIIKIATWNIGQDLKNNEINKDSYEYIKEQIEQNEIDIIAFQEAITESDNLEALANYISENTKLKYNEQISLSPSDMNKNDKMGIAICSKFKISNNEKYILENQNSFELKDIFECGQCFRWNEQEDGSYIGVIKNGVIQVKKEKKICKEKNGAKEINKTKEIITFTGKCDGNLQEIVEKYFDLNRDYEKIKSQLENIDEYLKTSIEYGKGIRILNQDLWETIISFIISANNNIPRIKGIIERISQKYGNEIEWNGKKYYTFPTPEQLKDVTVQEFRNLGLGFRDIRLYETTQMILNKEVDLEKLRKNPNTQEVRNELLKLSGVGPKVADCILLFSDLKRFDVFPIDVWVRRVMNDLYIKESDESKVSKAKIEKLAEEKFGDLKGLAQQYLFYWRREA